MQVNSRLHITAGYKNNKTYLKNSYCKQPFKLANITEEKNGNLLKLMMTSSSPGILNNDTYEIEIEIEENARVHLVTQSYQRLFTMANTASQSINVYIGTNGSFCFLPHPNVPHKASSFSSVNNIYLNKNHSLVWSEIITCGRKLSGEEFMFTRFQTITNIYLNKKLVVKENVLLEPLKKNIHLIGQLENYTHQATLLFVNDKVNMREIRNECEGLLSSTSEIAFGISMLPVNGLIVRILGQKAEKLFEYNRKLTFLIQQLTDYAISILV